MYLKPENNARFVISTHETSAEKFHKNRKIFKNEDTYRTNLAVGNK